MLSVSCDSSCRSLAPLTSVLCFGSELCLLKLSLEAGPLWTLQPISTFGGYDEKDPISIGVRSAPGGDCRI
jgi:hypothetical protein